jgi:hypothetical protein
MARSHEVDMTDSPRSGSPSEPTGPYGNPYRAYLDPAYAGNSPYDPTYSALAPPTVQVGPTPSR